MLLLVRHGETEWNKDGRFQGQLDIPLSEPGRAQARALRARLEVADHAHLFDAARTAVVASDLQRARETAELAFGVAGRTLHVHRDLREFHYGVFEGLTRREADERFPGALAAWVAGDRARPIEGGGESRAAVHARAHAAVSDFLARVSHPGVVIVSHGGVMRQLLSTCFPPDEPWTLSMANTVAHLVRVEQSSWSYVGQL